MIIFLSELQKEHLSMLHTHSTQVLIDFCKLAIDYLNNGINQKKYSNAAGESNFKEFYTLVAVCGPFHTKLPVYGQFCKTGPQTATSEPNPYSEKLEMPVSTIQNLVYALTYLLVEACKHNLAETDFKSSLAIAGFTSEHQEVLVKLYATKKAELSGAMYLLQQKDPTYQDLTWRFEVQVASQRNSEEIKPTVAMDFVLMTSKMYSQNKDEIRNKTDPVKINISPTHVNVSIQEAKAASQCQNVINHVLLQCDLPNLVHMTNKLDQALKESKSQHVRKVQRAL